MSAPRRFHSATIEAVRDRPAAERPLAELNQREERRPFGTVDVVVPLLRALCGGLCIGGLALVAIGVARVWVIVPAYWSGVVCVVAVAGLWFRYSAAAFQDEARITVHEVRERRDLGGEVASAPPAVVHAPPERMAIDLQRAGPRYHGQRTEIPLPKVGGNKMALFFWYVLREDLTLSLRAGHRYEIQRPEVKAIQDYFTTWELGEDLGGTQGVKPNEEGREMMRGFIRRYYPDAPLPREREEGA